MNRFLALFLGLLLFTTIVPVTPLQAQQAVQSPSGFSLNDKGTLTYTHPRSRRVYTLTQPTASLKTLRSIATPLTKQEWETMKRSLVTKRDRSLLFTVSGDTKKVWYFLSPGKPLYYFDGTPASLVVLRTQLPQKAPAPVTPPLSPAFSYTKQSNNQVVVMDVSKGLKMDLLTGHNSIRPTEECRYPKYCKAEAQAEAFASYLARSNKAPLVINGGYFDAYSQPLNEKNFHTVSSDLVINGKMESLYGWDKAWGDGGMIAQKKDGSFAFYYPIRNWITDAEQIQTAVSNYPLVLLNGAPRTKEQMPVSDPNDYKFWLSARRGGMGLSADGTKVVYVSTVGTVEDLGRALLNAGASNGFALDAGGSNGFAFQGKALFTPGRKLTSVISFR
ncbi:phosphodiester glycosidase family protein [Patescibacteria group bacterium]|nr:phosphodiester glycosidase family protein [Patescibacteria group bacterium]